MRCLPSDESEAPESRNSSEPIWMGKTLPAGNMSAPGDSAIFLTLVRSIERPCGPVPLVCSLRFCPSLSVFGCWAVSVSCGADADAVACDGRASEVAATATVGEVAEASEDVLDLFGRFAGLSGVSVNELAV
jgi:hypothetical protein